MVFEIQIYQDGLFEIQIDQDGLFRVANLWRYGLQLGTGIKM